MSEFIYTRVNIIDGHTKAFHNAILLPYWFETSFIFPCVKVLISRNFLEQINDGTYSETLSVFFPEFHSTIENQ